MPEELVDQKAVAKLLGVKPETVKKWRVRGVGPPYHRVGRGLRPRIRYRQSEVEEWLQRRE